MKKAATSTSRAAGKLEATLVTTEACLPQNAKPKLSPDRHVASQRRLSIPREDLPYSRAGRPSDKIGSIGTIPDVVGAKPVKTATTVAKEGGALFATTTEIKPERAENTILPRETEEMTDDGPKTRKGGGQGPVPCRERSSGPFRGGDLM